MYTVIHIPETSMLKTLGRNGEYWVKNTWDRDGFMCLHGAIRRCQPQPGDAYLVEQVAVTQGWGPAWNDDEHTHWGDVRERIAHLEVSDIDLADTFGPQWEQVVALVRRAAVLTTDEGKQLEATWWYSSGYASGRPDASDVARGAARVAVRAARWESAMAAAGRATSGPEEAYAAAQAAAQALVVRDLIGQHGFTQAHYDVLTLPWRTVVGPVHPDDLT